jgi:Right handed beta helix region
MLRMHVTLQACVILFPFLLASQTAGVPGVVPQPFVGQTGGALSGGGALSTIRVSPVPAGVNGSDTNHLLWISGGTGAAEPCLIQGGTAVAGASSGTIVCALQGPHGGAWRITSATSGIAEAISSLGSAGGTVMLPPGVYQVHARIVLPSNTWLRGSGMGNTVLRVAPREWKSSRLQWGTPVTSYARSPWASVIQTTPEASNCGLSDFTVDANSTNQSLFNYGSDIVLVGTSNCNIERVEVINGKHGGSAIAVLGDGTHGRNNRVVATHISNNDSGGTETCPGGIFVQGVGTLIEGNTVEHVCDVGIAVNASTTPGMGTQHGAIVVNNRVTQNPANHNPAYTAENTTGGVVFLGNYCTEASFCFQINPTRPKPPAGPVADVILQGNQAYDATNDCIIVNSQSRGGGTFNVNNVVIDGNLCRGAGGTGIVVSTNGVPGNPSIGDITISHNIVHDNCRAATGPCSGVAFLSGVGSAGRIIVEGNTVNHNGTAGIGQDAAFLFASGTRGLTPSDNVILTNNICTDTGSPKVQDYCLVVEPNTRPPANWIVRDNDMRGNAKPAGIVNVPGFLNSAIGPNLTDDNSSGLALPARFTFANLPPNTDGSLNGVSAFCIDCRNSGRDGAAEGADCVPGGHGAPARGLRGRWQCN